MSQPLQRGSLMCSWRSSMFLRCSSSQCSTHPGSLGPCTAGGKRRRRHPLVRVRNAHTSVGTILEQTRLQVRLEKSTFPGRGGLRIQTVGPTASSAGCSMQMQGPWTRRRLSRSCVWRRHHAAWGWREARLASLFFHCEVGRFFCCESLLRGHFFRHSHS